MQQQPLKHNVIERDKVLVPPHWDSWGKIRVLREGFDVEGINSGWGVDISSPPAEAESEGGAVEVYEDVIKDSKRSDSEGLALLNKNGAKGIEVSAVDTQDFLAIQLESLEAKAAEEKTARGGKEDKNIPSNGSGERVIEHVGPVQFNVGGIQVDAENMLERLKVNIELWRLSPLFSDKSKTGARGEQIFRPRICANYTGWRRRKKPERSSVSIFQLPYEKEGGTYQSRWSRVLAIQIFEKGS